MKQMETTSCILMDHEDSSMRDSSGSSIWKKAIHLIGWIIGVVALYVFLTRYFEWDIFRQNLSQANWRMLAATIGAYCLGLVVRAVRWTYMVRCHQQLSWIEGYHVIMISNMANFLFPVRLGEVLKLVIVKKSFGVAYCSSTAASIIEKLTLFMIIIVFLSLTPFAGYHFSDWSAKFFPFLILLLLVSAIFLFFGTRSMDIVMTMTGKILRFFGMNEDQIQRILTSRLVTYIDATLRQCHISSYTGSRFFWIAGMGLITLVLDGLANYYLLRAFGLYMTYLQAIIAACFFNVLFLLPSPPVQVGTAEMFPVVIYAAGLKLAAPVVATSALLWHVITVVILTLLGFVSLYAVGLRIGSVMNMANKESEINRDIS